MLSRAGFAPDALTFLNLVRAHTLQGTFCDPYHGFCRRGGCHIRSKGSTAVATIPKAQETGRLEVVTQATATTIEVDANGRVAGVNCIEGGTEYFQPAHKDNEKRMAAFIQDKMAEPLCRRRVPAGDRDVREVTKAS
jgi:hypothetical protein